MRRAAAAPSLPVGERRRPSARGFARRRVRLAAVVLVASMGAVAALPAGGFGGPSGAAAASQAEQPALAFTENTYALILQQRLMPIHTSPTRRNEHNPDQSVGTMYFGQINVAQKAATPVILQYKVEAQPDAPGLGICATWAADNSFAYNSNCEGLHVNVIDATGRMYLYSPTDNGKSTRPKYRSSHQAHEFTPQRVEVSALDSATGRKVYNEVMVTASPRVPDCSDYPDMDANRYGCLYLKQLLPETALATTQALIDALSDDLFQDAENYRLVFSEEFEGTPEPANAAGCRNGMTLIDSDYFTYEANTCNSKSTDIRSTVDGRGVPCQNVADGKYYGAAAHTCGSAFDTVGKMRFTYGYIEHKYTMYFPDASRYMNAAFVMGDPRGADKILTPQYGITVDSYEDLLKYHSQEVDVTEFTTSGQDISHRNHNNPARFDSATDMPANSSRRTYFCVTPPSRFEIAKIFFFRFGSCGHPPNVTITRGIEWTPKGYRYFMKVDGATSYSRCRQALSSTVDPTTRCNATDLSLDPPVR